MAETEAVVVVAVADAVGVGGGEKPFKSCAVICVFEALRGKSITLFLLI